MRLTLGLLVLAGGLSSTFAQEKAAPAARWEVPGDAPSDGTPVGVIVDDGDARHVEITAYWKRLTADEAPGAYGTSTLYDGGTRADGVVRFRPDLETAGSYRVYLYWPVLRREKERLATNVPVTVRHAGGSAEVRVNQRAQAEAWALLGTYAFSAGQAGYVEIRNDAADGSVFADAVLFVPARN